MFHSLSPLASLSLCVPWDNGEQDEDKKLIPTKMLRGIEAINENTALINALMYYWPQTELMGL